MLENGKAQMFAMLMAFGLLGWACGPAVAAVRIEGQVQVGGDGVAGSTVSLWAAGAAAPARLAQVQTDADGKFVVSVDQTPSGAPSSYLVASGGTPAANKAAGNNPAIGLLAVLGGDPPVKVVVNEMTTVASVWTNAQFLDGTAIKGHALGLRIAAGNVPNFVDLATGGWGEAIQNPLNSSQTSTMANFATLADLLAGCAARVSGDACSKLFAAATSPTGSAPADTLTAAESIARYPWYQPEKLFALLDQFYPVPKGKIMRAVPFMPYLNFVPSAWVLPLKFDGGGYVAGGKGMFDRATSGSATISRSDGRGRTRPRLGRARPPNSRRTVGRSRRLPPASPAAECKGAPSVPLSTPTTMPGSPATAASRSQCSTRTASR
jgi:hypothetical protein